MYGLGCSLVVTTRMEINLNVTMTYVKYASVKLFRGSSRRPGAHLGQNHIMVYVPKYLSYFLQIIPSEFIFINKNCREIKTKNKKIFNKNQK